MEISRLISKTFQQLEQKLSNILNAGYSKFVTELNENVGRILSAAIASSETLRASLQKETMIAQGRLEMNLASMGNAGNGRNRYINRSNET